MSNMKTNSDARKSAIGENIEAIVPFAILICFMILFAALAVPKGSDTVKSDLTLVLNKAIPYIVAGMGTLFVTAMGGTDITHGALMGFVFAAAVQVGAAAGSVAGIIVGLLCGVVSGFTLGFVNTKCKVPSFMVSLGLLVFFRALAVIVGGTEYIDVPDFIKVFGNFAVAIPITVVLFILMNFVFQNTPFGHYVRAIGENENAVKFIGVDADKVKIIAFTISGLFIAIASILNLGSKSTLLPSTTGLGFEMSVLIAMFIGGVPVRGGYGCKMYMLVVGALTVAFMENILGSLLLLETYYVQLIKGLFLIGILTLSSIMKAKTAKNVVENN